jgi:hypothetical protein
MAKDKKTSSLGSKILKGAIGTGAGSYGLDILMNILNTVPMKDGGRVKGCGVAKRGFGRAMKRKK